MRVRHIPNAGLEDQMWVLEHVTWEDVMTAFFRLILFGIGFSAFQHLHVLVPKPACAVMVQGEDFG